MLKSDASFDEWVNSHNPDIRKVPLSISFYPQQWELVDDFMKSNNMQLTDVVREALMLCMRHEWVDLSQIPDEWTTKRTIPAVVRVPPFLIDSGSFAVGRLWYGVKNLADSYGNSTVYWVRRAVQEYLSHEGFCTWK